MRIKNDHLMRRSIVILSIVFSILSAAHAADRIIRSDGCVMTNDEVSRVQAAPIMIRVKTGF